MPSYKKLSPSASTNGLPSSSSSSSKKISKPPVCPKPLSYDEIIASGRDKPPPLSLGDRIVWISDDGPEYGTVEWLGKLPDQGDEWMAGINFEQPIGTGFGDYNGFRLFNTAARHASLVPIVGLMKASDYSPSNDNNSVSNNFPLRPPRKVKVKPETYKFYIDENQNLSKNDKTFTERKNLTEDNSEIFKNGDHHSPTERAVDVPLYKVDMEQVDNSRFLRRETTKNIVSSPESNNKNINNDYTYEIGSMVKFEANGKDYYGVIKWMGIIQNDIDSEYAPVSFECVTKTEKNINLITVGIEVEDDKIGISDGTLGGKRYFTCPPDRAYFVSLSKCTRDDRFTSSIASSSNLNTYDDLSASSSTSLDSKYFGGIDCPVVLGHIDPITTLEDFENLLGKNRGIQGHHNSCYLDATLFSMFASSTVFDSLLNRPQSKNDIAEYSEVQKILKEDIVNSLRANYYVRADRVLKLRHLLEKISSMRGLTSEEKDPEEFLDMLLAEVLKAEPFLKFSTGLNSFCYQLFVEKDDSIELPTVQLLFEQSFFNSDLKLKEIPPCLILQMPRFGRQFKTYPRIMPTLYLDITNVLDNSPRECVLCNNLAFYECKDCFGLHAIGLESVSYCGDCFKQSHSRSGKDKHTYSELNVPESFKRLKECSKIPRVMMELFAVLCIETSHYVSFVKCGSQPNAPWCFFDSMADRRGGQNGYNIPEVTHFSEMNWWLGKEGCEILKKKKDDKILPEFPRRLFSDAYICFYSSEVQRYR